MVRWNMNKIYNYCKTNNLDLPECNQKYIKNSSKYFYLCKYHGHYKQRWADHKKGQGCPICSKYKAVNNRKGKTSRKLPITYYNECLTLGYDLPIEEYKGTHTKIKHICSKGHIYEQTPHNHLQGQGCFSCKGNKKKSSDEYENECIERGLDLPNEPYHDKLKRDYAKKHDYKLLEPSYELNTQDKVNDYLDKHLNNNK